MRIRKLRAIQLGAIMRRALFAITGVMAVALWSATVYAGVEAIVEQSVSNRFVFSDQTVKDKRTGLIWSRDADLGKKDWQGALELIKELNIKKYASFEDWRLPSIEELGTLQAYAIGVGCDADFKNNSGVFNGIAYIHFNRIGFYDVQDEYYWSSTSLTESPEQAMVSHMYSGSISGSANKKKYTYSVWPVRGGN